MNFEAPSIKKRNTVQGSVSTSFESAQPWTCDVFLSFRGKDTRTGFTDHLYAALNRKGIVSFRDDEDLAKAESIAGRQTKLIEKSPFALVILSENYAASTFCLDELQKILQCRMEMGQVVIPIFYHVHPSDVRLQKGTFSEAFRKHEERFKDNKEKVKRWREALTEISSLSGFLSKKLPETKLIEDIVESVWTKLYSKLPSHMHELVGMDSKMKDMDSVLQLESDDVRFIGIWGMGGIGKTTLARAVFERIRNQFEVCCFVANIREVCEKEGLIYIQRVLLSSLMNQNLQIDDPYEGSKIIRKLSCTKKVLLVLDDINSEREFMHLAGSRAWFGPGSRVIVTTRDMHLLLSLEVFDIYKIELLRNDESFELFCNKAFRGDPPEGGYLKYSKSVVQYASGLPLALKVLGASLYRRSMTEWKHTLLRIQNVPPMDILGTLKISFDGLEDLEKTVFLDIACFFEGVDRDQAIQILEACGLHPNISIQVLVEKALLTCNGVRLGMHNIVQEMGKHIVYRESPIDSGKRSRLWNLDDIDHVLRENKGTEAIRGIVLKLPQPYEAKWDPTAFAKISGLQLLIISSDLHLPCGLNCFPSALKYLKWSGYPLKSLPLDLRMNELVELEMRNSKMSVLWNGVKFFSRLKFLDLSHSVNLIQTPNFSGVPNLERLDLEGCTNLLEIHPSLGLLKKLIILNLKDCVNLRSLPCQMETSSLEKFILSGCSKLSKLPDFGENMECLSVIDLSKCRSLGFLPRTLGHLTCLKSLKLSGCSKFSKLPNTLNEITGLVLLDVSGTVMGEVPQSIVHLVKLKELYFRGCKASTSRKSYSPFRWLQWRHQGQIPMGLVLPPSISGLSSLQKLDLGYCNLHDGSFPSDFGSLPSLEILDLSGNHFINLPASTISNLMQLKVLYLDCCPRLKSLPELKQVDMVYTRNCPSIQPSTEPSMDSSVESFSDERRLSSMEPLKPGYPPSSNTMTNLFVAL